MSNKVQDKLRKMMKSEQIKNSIPEALCFGRISSINPLIILLNGKLPLYDENLVIPNNILEHTEYVEAITSTNGEHSHNHNITQIKYKSQLEIGKLVVLYGLQYREISGSYQRYLLLKVI